MKKALLLILLLQMHYAIDLNTANIITEKHAIDIIKNVIQNEKDINEIILKQNKIIEIMKTIIIEQLILNLELLFESKQINKLIFNELKMDNIQ